MFAPPGVMRKPMAVAPSNLLQRSRERHAGDAAADPLEQEADRIADQVTQVSRKCDVCAAAGEQRLHRKASGTVPEAAPAIVREPLHSPGAPLDAASRAFFEARFGQDFSRVRVHTDARAAESARAVNARAYAVGQEIVFGAREFAPSTPAGKRLIAHELTHTLQQAATGADVLQRSPDDKGTGTTEEKPVTKFVGCDKDQQSVIEAAITQAEGLASRATQALKQDFPLSYETSAMGAHFGSLSSDQQSTVIARYEQIGASLRNKSYACQSKGEKVKEGKERVDFCGKASCPGDKIKLFPIFGKDGCPAGPVILHEAAHNAGACDDIEKGKGYPPKKPENNAYCYENFAVDVAAGLKDPVKLKKREGRAPP